MAYKRITFFVGFLKACLTNLTFDTGLSARQAQPQP